MRQETSKKIFSYWNNLRKGRPAPDRREIEPSDIRDLLGDTFILEVDPSFRTVSFRLAGTRLCSAYGRELKGVGFLGLWDEQDNMDIFNAVKQVHENLNACTISFLAETEQNKFAEFELIMLPLLNDSSKSVRILGCASPDEAPYWLGTESLVNNRVKHIRTIDQSQIETSVESLPELQNAPNLTPELHSELPDAKRVGHLLVLDGGLQS